MGFRATEVGSSDEEEMDPEDRKKRAQKLTEALAVLAIRPPQFHSLSNSGRLEPVSTQFFILKSHHSEFPCTFDGLVHQRKSTGNSKL